MCKTEYGVGVLRFLSLTIPCSALDLDVPGNIIAFSFHISLHQVPVVITPSFDRCPLCINPGVAVYDQSVTAFAFDSVSSFRYHDLTL